MVYTDGEYLFADSIVELHQFAEACEISLDAYFNQLGGQPHYKITEEDLIDVYMKGAIKVTSQWVIDYYSDNPHRTTDLKPL